MQPLSGSPFTRTYALDSGPRVRIRLARRSDRAAVVELLAGCGVGTSTDELARLLSYDPIRRLVVCATAPLDGADTLVGLGAIELRVGAGPDTVVVDERRTVGLGELLDAFLRSRALAHGRRAAELGSPHARGSRARDRGTARVAGARIGS